MRRRVGASPGCKEVWVMLVCFAGGMTVGWARSRFIEVVRVMGRALDGSVGSLIGGLDISAGDNVDGDGIELRSSRACCNFLLRMFWISSS